MNMHDIITLEPYNPSWKKLAEIEIQQLQAILPQGSFYTIEHIGSTAINEIPAKSIIDLMIGVEDIEAAKTLIPLIEAQGYAYWKENPKKDRLFFVKGLPEKGGNGRTHHIHIFETHHYEYYARPLFRNYLNAHADFKTQYAQLKKSLAEKYQQDREAYTAAKSDFINRTSLLAIKEKINIRIMNKNDFELMHHWFNQTHVQNYYSLRSWTLEEVKKKLTPYLQEDSSIKGYIISIKKLPIAYIQYSVLTYNPWPGQDFSDDIINHGVGIDFFIGESSFLQHSLGSQIISHFLDEIIWPHYSFCAADPDVTNLASINTLRKIGFSIHKKISDLNPLKQSVQLQLMLMKKSQI